MKVHPGSRRGLALLAVAVAALIAAALVVVLLASRALVPSSSVPAGVGDQATAQYVALVEADDQLITGALGDAPCQGAGYDSACHAKIQKMDVGARKFQADLERVHPPARLAGKHARLRADLARLESVFHDSLKYLDAQDYAAMDAQIPDVSAAFAAYNADVSDILSTPH